jgi:23S rRNA (uridine2552-2'-O)-methyltransferase
MIYQPQDRFFKQAKREGYRSRAAYKLLDLQQRHRVLRPGEKVVDLGAAPGGWLQVAAKIVGASGRVIGVDLQEIQPLPGGNIVLVHGDAASAEVQDKIREELGG